MSSELRSLWQHPSRCWLKPRALQALNWSEVRRRETLQAMLKEELAMVDDQGPSGHRLYWFPCLSDFSGGAVASAA